MIAAKTLIIGTLIFAGAANAAPRLDAEARIAKALAGRVAGPPTDCIYQRDIASSQIIDGTAILYTMNNRTIYLNRPTSGVNFLHTDLILVTDTHSPQLCGVDIVRLYDSSSRMQMGSLGLGPFVPYPKPANVK